VQWLLDNPVNARQAAQSIPEDGRWRDALELYAEVASEDESIALAEFCHANASQLLSFAAKPGEPPYTRGLHCLRFLVDAFRARPQYLFSLKKKLDDFISEALYDNDILVRKNAVEAIGLLDSEQADKMIARALESNDQWTSETAFRSCKYLPSLTTRTLLQMSRYLLSLSASELIRQYNELRLLVRISESINKLRLRLRLRTLEAALALLMVPVYLVFRFPLLLLVLLIRRSDVHGDGIPVLWLHRHVDVCR
jgi:HEAT repeat protein